MSRADDIAEYKLIYQSILALKGEGKVKASDLPDYSPKDVQALRDLVKRLYTMVTKSEAREAAEQTAFQQKLGMAPIPTTGMVASLPDPDALYKFRAATYEQYRSQ
jgi:hypothetical protein